MLIIRTLFWLLCIGVGSVATAQLEQLVQDKTPEAPEYKELKAFMDGVWQAQSESHRAAGGVVTVVSGDRVLLNKGYGIADVETLSPVNPETTMFRIASVSKTFTWIAVMQLVEQGKLELDRDVNDYLKAFQIPATYPEPITMAHLMSHNAGFEDVVLNLGRRDAAELEPLGQYLSRNLPRRVRPPGQHSSYSNHSTAIAAHIVEEISGLDWFTYIEQNILGRLGMENTSSRHPMSEQHRSQLAKSYTWSGGSWREQDFLHWTIYPAGMMSTSGADMAIYMQAHLNGGAGLLQPETFAQMLEPLWQPVPGGSRWLHGYTEETRNGVRIYGHGGDLNGFHSTMMILPEQNLALFASFNTDPSAAIRSSLANAFVDHFYPQSPILRDKPTTETLSSQQDYHGSYGRLRRNFSDFSKLAMLLGAVTVATNDQGYLTLTSQSGTKQFVRLKDDLFGARYDSEEILFIRSEDGEVTHIESSGYPAAAMDKLSLKDDPKLHQVLFALVAIVAVAYLIYWPILLISQRFSKAEPKTSLPTAQYLFSWFISLMTLYGIVRLVQGLGNQEQFYFGIPEHIEILLRVLLINCGLIVVNAVWTLMVLVRNQGTTIERINFAVFTASGLLYVWLSSYWNTLSYYF